MTNVERTWAVVLAGGDGTRLAALTVDARGAAVPKQYCSLYDGASLLQRAVQRARRIVARDRLCVIVAEQHRHHWRSQLSRLPASNVIVQPRNRGTANGVLLSVLSILRRDPLASIMFLPADHHVRDEAKFATAMRNAAHTAEGDAEALTLIGIEPDEPDPELGYIVPGRARADGSRFVERFIEKPAPSLARELMSAGALWNSLIFAAAGSGLLDRLRVEMGWIVGEMTRVLERGVCAGPGTTSLAEFYEPLPSVDFSRTVLQRTASLPRVVTAPQCGWSDLGTPTHVADTLRRLQQGRLPQPVLGSAPIGSVPATALVNLATQHSRSEGISPGDL